MKSFLTAAAAMALVPAVLALTMDTPTNVVKCQPILLNCRDGTPPYFISMIPGGQPNAPALKQFDQSQTGQITWQVDIGGSLTGQCRDSTGTTAYTDVINVQNADATCNAASSAPAGSSSPAAGAPSSSAPGSGPATSTPAATTPSAPQSSAANSASRTSSTPRSSAPTGTAPPATSTSNAAVRIDGRAFGFTGLVGLIGAAALL